MDTLLLSCYLGIMAISMACFYVVVPLTFNIIIHATLLIIIGSINSVKFMIRDKISRTDFTHEAVVESVGMKEAYKFPIIGSLLLFTLYVLVKYFGKEAVSALST